MPRASAQHRGASSSPSKFDRSTVIDCGTIFRARNSRRRRRWYARSSMELGRGRGVDDRSTRVALSIPFLRGRRRRARAEVPVASKRESTRTTVSTHPRLTLPRLPSRFAHSLPRAVPLARSLALSVSLPILCTLTILRYRPRWIMGARAAAIPRPSTDGTASCRSSRNYSHGSLFLAPVTTRRKGTRSIARLRTSWLADAVV